jgi:hypothetical protein
VPGGGGTGSARAGDAAPARAAAVPAAEAVCKVTFQYGSNSFETVTMRSFAWSGSSTGSSGSGGGSRGGVFAAGNPTINTDTGAFSPAVLKALYTGQHWQSVTVVLYRPGTTTRFDQWTFLDVQLREVRANQSGPHDRRDVLLEHRDVQHDPVPRRCLTLRLPEGVG